MRNRITSQIKTLLGATVAAFLFVGQNSLAQSRRVDQKAFPLKNMAVEVKNGATTLEYPLMTFSPQDVAADFSKCPVGDACIAHSVAFNVAQFIPTGTAQLATVTLKYKYFINGVIQETKELDLGTTGKQYKMFQFNASRDLNVGVHSIQVIAFAKLATSAPARWITITSVEPMVGISRVSSLSQMPPNEVSAGATGKYVTSTGRLPITIKIATRYGGDQLFGTEMSYFKEFSMSQVKTSTQQVPSDDFVYGANAHTTYSNYTTQTVTAFPLIAKINISADSGSGASATLSRSLPSTRAHYSVLLQSFDWVGKSSLGYVNYKVNTISKPVNMSGSLNLAMDCYEQITGSISFKAPTTYDNSASTIIGANELAGYMLTLTTESNPNKNQIRPAVMAPKSNVIYNAATGVSSLSFVFGKVSLSSGPAWLKVCPIGSDQVEGLCEMIPVSLTTEAPPGCGYGGGYGP